MSQDELQSCPQTSRILCGRGNRVSLERLAEVLQHVIIFEGTSLLIKGKHHNNYDHRGHHTKGRHQGREANVRGGRAQVCHSLPHIGMSLLSAFITMDDILMVTGMASK